MFDLETCSKIVEDGASGQNTYAFLLVFYSNFGHISYYRYAEMTWLGEMAAKVNSDKLLDTGSRNSL